MPPWSIAVRTAFGHVDTRFTPLSVQSYSNRGIRVVHCLLSYGNCRALSGTVSASSFRGFPLCALILSMNVRAPRMALAGRHSIIVLIMSAFESPSNVVRGSLPIHLDTLVKVVSLSHRYSKSVPFLAYVLSSHQDLLEVFVRLNHSVTVSIGGCAQSLCLMKHFALFHSSSVASNPASLIWPNDCWLLEFLGNTIPPHLSALCGTPFARNS